MEESETSIPAALRDGWRPYALWGGATLGVTLLVGLGGDDFLVAVLWAMAIVIALVVWVGLAIVSLRRAWQAGRGLLAGLPLAALMAVALLLIPCLRIGARLHAYALLASHWSEYQALVADEARKPAPDMLIWEYGGWLSTELVILHDPHSDDGKVAQRVARKFGARGEASCAWLIGHYYDCGLSL